MSMRSPNAMQPAALRRYTCAALHQSCGEMWHGEGHPGDPRFASGARAALADLRQLEVITAKAVRTSAATPAVIRALAAVRRRYDELMTTAAGAPGATLGQRLYTARRQSNLSVAEAAEALNAPQSWCWPSNARNPRPMPSCRGSRR